MITLTSCPVCGSHRIAEYQYAWTLTTGIYEIMPAVKVDAAIFSLFSICQKCKLIFQNPRLSDAQLNRFYNQDYYHRMLDSTEEQRDVAEQERAKIDAKIIRQYLGMSTSHLDIGCGSGYLFDEVGANIKVGVEANASYVRVKDAMVYREMSKIPYKKFDLVTAIHVLEHVPIPLDYLKRMAKFVKKGGYLVVEVPTWKSPGGSLRFPHLYHFEPDVLRQICVRAGLKVIQEVFTPHLMFICQVERGLDDYP